MRTSARRSPRSLATPSQIRVSVKCAREPVYLAFRYRKLGRRTPQSSWVVDGRVKVYWFC